MSNMAIMCRCVEISLLGYVEQNVVQNVPSLTRFLPLLYFFSCSIYALHYTFTVPLLFTE